MVGFAISILELSYLLDEFDDVVWKGFALLGRVAGFLGGVGGFLSLGEEKLARGALTDLGDTFWIVDELL